MIILRVNFHHWNNFDKIVDATSDMCPTLKKAKNDEELIVLAIKYIKSRWIECMHINSVEIIAN